MEPQEPHLFDSIAKSKCLLGLTPDDGGGDEQPSNSPPSTTVEGFFGKVWQKQPALFVDTPLRKFQLTMDWDDVADLLHHSHEDTTASPPLFYQEGRAIADPEAAYGCSPFAAYLDGCSVIVNHADHHHSKIAGLCDELQRTFPHVYANTYLTPPRSSAVKSHSDDRDVLVVQILGKKNWKVYKTVPVEFPFANEQVGKGRPVPRDVLDGGLCFDGEVTLEPGHVLYMPRGFVHEASTDGLESDEPSFHITIAIATHDWCMSTVLTEVVRKRLNECSEHRMPLPIGTRAYQGGMVDQELASSMDNQLVGAMDIIRGITAADIERTLRNKYQLHNSVAKAHRSKLDSRKRKVVGDGEVVGPSAASSIRLDSSVRRSTDEERSSVQLQEGRLRGLTVREETMGSLMSVLGRMKGEDLPRSTVRDLRNLYAIGPSDQQDLVCEFTLLCFAKCCVELGGLAVMHTNE